MRIHLGCGKRYLKDFYHIDCESYPHIDQVSQINNLDFLDNNIVDEIYTSHAFEYFDDYEAPEVLSEWYRVLKTDGIIRLSVPNFDALLKVYEKSENIEDINGPLYGRWENDKNIIYHKTCYNFSKLRNLLEKSNFYNIETWDSLEFFKTIDPEFDDYSKAYYPHMDFKNGFPISLNIKANKK